MEVIGISNTSERCSAEGRITVLVRDSTGKLLNLDLGIGYSSRLVPKSIISVAQLMTKGSIFHFEMKLLPTYTYQSTDYYYRTQWTFLYTTKGTAKRRREDRRG